MAIVTVDFDGTLFKGDSFKVMFQAAKKEFTWKEWRIVGTGLVKAVGKGLIKGKEAFKHGFFKAFARSFRGKSAQELDRFFSQLIQMGKPQINWELVEGIKTHQKDGDTVIVLSGALHPFLKSFIETVGLDVHIISTRLQFDDSGFCTGEIDQLVNGPVKVEKVKQWIEQDNPDNLDKRDKRDNRHEDNRGHETEPAPVIWAYADSLSDVPLLHFVDYPVVVNPKKDMLQEAKQHSWPIFPETS